MAQQRDHTLDILRGIAILFVVFGHIQHLGGETTNYIWSFHLPLFFFISGMLYRPEKFENFKTFLKAKVIGIIIPYVFFYVISFTYWVLIERHMRGADIPIWQYMIGLPYGTYDVRFNDFNGSLWFLPALFSVEMIYYWIAKLKSVILNVVALIGVFVAGYFFREYLHALPMGIDAAMMSVCFYGFGHLVMQKGLYEKSKQIKVWIQLSIILVMILLHYTLLPFTGVDLCQSKIDHPFFYIPVALVGIIGYFFVACILRRDKVLEWMGRSSLVIFAFHGHIFRVVLFIESKITHLDVGEVRQSAILCVICLVVTILAIWPLNYGYDKWIAPKFKYLLKIS